MNRKRIFFIITVLMLLFIFGTIFLFIDAFYGNPIGAAIAKHKIINYVEDKYSDMDLNVSKAKYNFKEHAYFSVLQSKTIKDMCFTVSYSGGDFYDTYEIDVIGRYKTFQRLSSELDSKVEELIRKHFKYETSILFADFTRAEADLHKLTLDMPLDITNPPLPTCLTVYILSNDISYDILSTRLLELHGIMENNNIPINLYTVVIREPMPEGEKAAPDGKSLHLFDFPADKLQSEDLIAAIQEHIRIYEAEHEK